MTKSRKAIAIASGVIFAFAHLAVSGTDDPGPRLFVGGFFGFGIATSMIRRPERISRNHIAFIIVPLMATLVAWVAIYKPENLISTIIWSLFFLASQVAFFQVSLQPGAGIRSLAMKQN
ncbi:MAG: hypothetical protein EOP09_15335 [Proteobacteria bacterium]|nr:MAG: hypothetical protein EOP09_15335 [Pseudomonadota bacterium]